MEIDLWNGNDGTPDVTHGNTLCTKIKLEEVLKVIANNTGTKSANLFPVILSLEDHCSIGMYFTLTFRKLTELGSLIGITQCGYFRIFLQFRFYVKAILVILMPQKLPF